MKTVLVVDDSATMRKMVMASLGPRYVYLQAGNGLEAIERLALGGVDLIVLDLNMPDMHGLDFLRFLSAHEALRCIPVIVLTTRGDDESRQQALALGAVDYFQKPFAPTELSGRANEVLKTVGT